MHLCCIAEEVWCRPMPMHEQDNPETYQQPKNLYMLCPANKSMQTGGHVVLSCAEVLNASAVMAR